MSFSSFDLDEASRLPDYARAAAVKIADSTSQLRCDDDVVNALIECGERPSLLSAWLAGIRVHAINRRNPI